LRLPRFAEVDSEVLFRLADRAHTKAQFKRLLALCRGRISAAFVNLNRPDRTWLLKGDMPLSLAYVSRFRMMFYASEGWMLHEALDGHEWQALELDPMTLSVFDGEDVLRFIQDDIRFRRVSATRLR